MGVNIPRHDSPTTDPAARVAALAEDARRSLAGLPEEPRGFGDAFQAALHAARGRSLVDPSAETVETWQSYVTAMQVGSALFAAAGAETGTVTGWIAGEVRAIPATGPQPYVTPATWLDAFWLAVICRDQDRAAELCEIPLDLLRAAGADLEDPLCSWVAALQTYWKGDPDLTFDDELAHAVKRCDPEAVAAEERERARLLRRPPMDLFHQFVRQDAAGFTTALVTALERHREFHAADPARAAGVEGLVPVDVLGTTCLAHEAGLTVDVTSGYLPTHLVRGSWLGRKAGMPRRPRQ